MTTLKTTPNNQKVPRKSTPLEAWLSEVENRINNRFDGSGDFTIKAPTDLKKAVRIIEELHLSPPYPEGWELIFDNVDKIAAMSSEEIWNDEVQPKKD